MITFNFTEQDLWRAQHLHTLDAYRRPAMIVRLLLLWVLLMSFFVFYEYRIGTPWPRVCGILPGLGLLVAIGLTCARLIVSLMACSIMARRSFRQDKGFRQSFSVSWDQEAFLFERPDSHSRIRWHDYPRWRENRHVFLFYLSDCLFQVLPKRVLTYSQIEDIRANLSVRRASET